MAAPITDVVTAQAGDTVDSLIWRTRSLAAWKPSEPLAWFARVLITARLPAA